MNKYRFALKVIAITGLVLGALLLLIGWGASSNDSYGPNVGAAVTAGIGEFILGLGIVGLFFWLLAESIAHGQRALIQTLQGSATTRPADAEPVERQS